jgi:hypothetical protein
MDKATLMESTWKDYTETHFFCIPQKVKVFLKAGVAGKSWLPQEGGFCNHGSDHIWIHVRSWPPVLKIALAFFFCVSANSNRRSTVCNTLSNNQMKANLTGILSIKRTSYTIVDPKMHSNHIIKLYGTLSSQIDMGWEQEKNLN